MGKFSGKLLITDFDDTFRPRGCSTVPEENLRAAEHFMAEGGLFTLATGRDPRSFLNILPLFTINAPAVVSNGAVIFDPVGGESLYESFLPFSCREDMKRILERYPEAGLEVVRGADVRVVRWNPTAQEHMDEMHASAEEFSMDHLMFPWTKTVLLAPGSVDDENTAAREMEAWILSEFSGRYEAVTSGAVVDIAAAGSDKGTGTAKLAELLDIPMENVICAGDGRNDLPMLRVAGRAFVPADAAAEVLAEPGVTVVGESAVCLRDIVERLEREG